MNDPLPYLAALPSGTPDAARSARRTARAHHLLAQQRTRTTPGRARPTPLPAWLVVAASLGAAYLGEVLFLAARVLATR